MIKRWTASPKKFDQFDIEKIGTGTGISRHGDGIYLGDKKLALEYLKEYDGFLGADLSIMYKGREVSGAAKEALEYLARNRMDMDKAIAHFSGHDEHLKILQRPELLDQVEFHYGMLAEVTIPNVDIQDFKHWDDEVPEDELDGMAMIFLSEVGSGDRIEECRSELEELGIDIEGIESLDEVIDELFDLAYEEALESGDLSFSIDEEDMRECWNRILRRDEYSTNDFEDEFSESFPKQHLSVLRALCKDGLTLEKESSLTYGNLYELTSQHLDDLKEKGRAISGITTPLLMTKFGVSGLRAPAIKADADTEELVIYSQELITSAKIKPEAVSNLNLQNDSPSVNF